MQRIKQSALSLVLDLAALVDPFDPEIRARITKSGHPTNDGTGVAEPKLKDKLKRVEADLAEARADRPALVEARDEWAGKYAGLEMPAVDSEEFKEAEKAVEDLGAHDDRIADLQHAQVGILKMLGRDAPQQRAERAAAGDPTDPRGGWHVSALEDPEMRAHLAKAASSTARVGPLELGQVASRDQLVTDITGSTDMRRGDWIGVVPQLRRMLRVLDLIPTGTMDQNTLPYTQEAGSLDTAAEVTEGNTKAEGAATFTDQEAIAETIAHYMKIRKQSLADYAALQSIISARLRYGVERRLEAQILAGDGSAPNLKGILNTSGIQTVPAASELVTDQVLKGLTLVLLANGVANGIVLHPLDWQAALLAKASGDGHYFSGGPFVVTPQIMWGTPLVPSPAIVAQTALVGDFEIGAQLFIREGVNVLLSDSDQDDFVKNRVTLLGEMRAALAVFQPTAFVDVDLSSSD